MWFSDFIAEQEWTLIQLAKSENALFIQIETLDYSWEAAICEFQNFHTWYYKKFITPFTAIIDLNKTDEEILAMMKPKWRYNIKLAKKKGVTVTKVKKTNENIKAYYDLSQETTKRDNFAWHKEEYYQTFLNTLQNSELFLASIDWEVIAGGIFVFEKNVSYYYYGASTSKKQFRNLMAPYLLQWEAIQCAKSLDSKIYDFLWVSWEWEYFDESLSGVTDFKKKLTPNIKHVSHSYIYIDKKIQYKIFNTVKAIKARM